MVYNILGSCYISSLNLFHKTSESRELVKRQVFKVQIGGQELEWQGSVRAEQRGLAQLSGMGLDWNSNEGLKTELRGSNRAVSGSQN